ncbi:hybrid sensor histidine kinase/response regulator transcription factor [Spirosoma rigui]|uniref:hybrid sensor histidine kinase/response regulator transcription factor n=1 Tax=Spirosoma rigui TaxID=564064 RepID=UPI0009B0966C|nr:ATP-binding protein [Spirosoma rigui]
MRLFYLLLFLPLTLAGQPKGWQELTISDGLSQGMIFGLKQDRKGFIWVATKDGLNRYDGHNFTVFTHDPYSDFSLSDNYCSALHIDSRGRIWVGTINQGLNLFDDRTQRFYHIAIRDQVSDDAGNYEIHLLTEDPEGNIWVGTNKDKLFKIILPRVLQTNFPNQADLTNQVQVVQIELPQDKTNSYIYHISFRPNGQAIVGTTYGFFSFNWQKPRKTVPMELAARQLGDFYMFYSDVKHNFLAATTTSNIVCWQQGVQKIIPFRRKNNFSVNLKAIDENTLAIATPDLLWVMSPAQLFALDSLTARNAFARVPPNVYTVTDLMMDKTGNIWLGTGGYGLRRYNPKIKPFRSFLADTSLGSLYIDRQNRTYVRHKYAYDQLDWSHNRLVPFIQGDLPAADKRQRHMMQDRQGNFWVSNVHFETHENRLFKFSSDWRLLKKYPLPDQVTFGFFNNCTFEDKAGYLWLGATNGNLLRFDPKTESFRVFSFQALLPRNGAEISTNALHQDQAGTLWIATQQGLVRADRIAVKPIFSLYKNDKANRRSLSNDFVSSLADDPYEPGRYLWLGTKGGGLERLDKKNGRFEHFTEVQGLPNKVVYGILVDESRNLWLSTNRGLSRYNPKTGIFRNYTKADGLQDDEFNTSSFYKNASGELLFGGVNGLTIFRPSEITPANAQIPVVNLIGLKVNNEVVKVGGADGILAQAIEYTRSIKLSHTQNLLTLEFAVMDFTNSVKNQYRYRLAGVDDDWVTAGTNRFANYVQLPDGNYTFQVEGSTDGESWSQPTELQIRVRPPFYRTWWAYLLYLLGLGFLAWQLYRFQKQRLLLQQQIEFEQKEATRLAELDALKTQFFANISHEFRTPLTLIMGPIEEAIQDYAADVRFPMIQRNANRLLGLINQLLDLSKLEAGQLKPESDRGDIALFFRALATSFTALAESRQIQFSFTQNESNFLAEFDRDKMEKIVTNLLSNAFKFTPAGNHVRIDVQLAPPTAADTLRITIEDSGIGISADSMPHIFERFYQVSAQTNRPYEGTGIGLALVNELVNVLEGTICVTSTEGMGTTFTVVLPLVAAADDTPHPQQTTVFDVVGPVPPGAELLQPASQPTPAPEEKILLIIDDNADIRAYVRRFFEGYYQVMEAADGQQGLEMATTHLPDVVICDLMMPRLDGFGFCRALKSEVATSHIPVVMLTARTSVERRVEGFELGADDYLTKPFNRAEIQARVHNLIRQRQRLYHYFAARQTAPAAALTVPTPLTAEQKFLDRLSAMVQQHLDDVEFTVEDLAAGVNMSRVQLHRKLKTLTNSSATNFIRVIRLTRAAELLAGREHSVTQVAYMTGFENLSYFAKVFQERYGLLPSQYGYPSTPPKDRQAMKQAE